MSGRARFDKGLAALCLALAGFAQAATTTSLLGVEDGFGANQQVNDVFDPFGVPDLDPQATDVTDQWSLGGLSWSHTYALPSIGTVVGASIELVAAGWGLAGAPALYINGVLVGTLGDGETDFTEYVRRDQFDLTPLLSQLQLDGTDTVSIVALAGPNGELDGGALDFARLTLVSEDATGGGTVPEPGVLTLALAGLAAAGMARRSRR